MQPTLFWKPRSNRRTRALDPAGSIGPFPSRVDAFVAARERRIEAGRGDHVFVLTTTAPASWVVYEYRENRSGRADLHELSSPDLPRGADPTEPETYVLDARGRWGMFVHLPGAKPALTRTALSEPEAAGPIADDARALAENTRRIVAGEALLPIAAPETLTNHGENVTWHPRFGFRPGRAIDALSRTLEWVDQTLPADVGVKAGGSRHSWSTVAVSLGVYIHPEGMSFVEDLGADVRADLDSTLRGNLVRVGSGTTIRTANRELWARGKALAALGGYDGQTFGGVLPTGTHGSRFRSGPLADIVHSIDLVRPDGTVARIEPRDGLTDPAAFRAEHPDDATPRWDLVQDDDDFNAAKIHVGTLGVVHAYVIEVRDRFHMREVRTKTTWRETREHLANGGIYRLTDRDVPSWASPDGEPLRGHPADAYHLEFLVNPHPKNRKSTDHLVVVTSRHPTELTGPEPPSFANPEPFERNLFRALSLSERITRHRVPGWLLENFPDLIGKFTSTVIDAVPDAAPGLIETAMESLADDVYVQRSYNVFHIGPANDIPAWSSELAVPIRDDLYLRAMDRILEVASRFARDDKYHTGPIAMRFVRASDALLADPEDVCKFEIIFSQGTDHARQMMQAYEDELFDSFGRDVRPHWGQINGFTRAKASTMFPHFATFDAIRARYDPKGRFLNHDQRAIFGG